MSEAAESVTLESPVLEPDSAVEAPDDSLAAHEAQFGRTQPSAAPAEDVPVPDVPKHRAKSQRAGASDYEDIAKYTKLLRETEEGIDGFAVEQQQGESDRVFNLRKRVEIAKLAKERRPAIAAPLVAAPAPVPVPAAAAPATAPAAFAEREPTLEDFGNEPDPYLALNRALSRWDRRKEQFEAQQEAAKQSQLTAAQQAQETQTRALVQGYQQRVDAFAKSRPDFQAVVASADDRPITPLLRVALLAADNGPELVYTLAQQPHLHDEAFLLTDGKPITEQSVASTQRWLSKLSLPAVSTGATAGASKPISTPRPPTPVRTGPIASGDDLPSDESSLADHEKAFGPRRRRR